MKPTSGEKACGFTAHRGLSAAPLGSDFHLVNGKNEKDFNPLLTPRGSLLSDSPSRVPQERGSKRANGLWINRAGYSFAEDGEKGTELPNNSPKLGNKASEISSEKYFAFR